MMSERSASQGMLSTCKPFSGQSCSAFQTHPSVSIELAWPFTQHGAASAHCAKNGRRRGDARRGNSARTSLPPFLLRLTQQRGPAELEPSNISGVSVCDQPGDAAGEMRVNAAAVLSVCVNALLASIWWLHGVQKARGKSYP